MKKNVGIYKGLVLGVGVALGSFGTAHAQMADDQIVTGVPATQSVATGDPAAVTAEYNVSNADNTLTGLGLRVHFDSTKLTFGSLSDVAAGAVGDCTASVPEDDTSDFDGDASTDKFVVCAWLDIQGNWPNVALPLNLLKANFTSNLASGDTTSVRFSASSTAAGYGFQSTPAAVEGAAAPPSPEPSPSSEPQPSPSSEPQPSPSSEPQPSPSSGPQPPPSVVPVLGAFGWGVLASLLGALGLLGFRRRS